MREYLIEGVRDYLASMNKLEVQCPVVIVVTILEAAGVGMDPEIAARWLEGAPIDRNVLLLPDILVEDYGCDVPRSLRPIFDAIWNATGFERSPNYGEDGNWRPWG